MLRISDDIYQLHRDWVSVSPLKIFHYLNIIENNKMTKMFINKSNKIKNNFSDVDHYYLSSNSHPLF